MYKLLPASMFESSVISYGSKTIWKLRQYLIGFESSVISYGSKTVLSTELLLFLFESSVISYGSKTYILSYKIHI